MTFTAFTTTVLPDAFVGVAYEASAAVNGATAAELTLSAGTTQTGKHALPSGLAYGTDGRITGTPTVAGIFLLSVKVTDGTSTKDNQAFTLTIHTAPIYVAGGRATEQGDAGSSVANDLNNIEWPS